MNGNHCFTKRTHVTGHVLAKTNQHVEYQSCVINNNQNIERKIFFNNSDPCDIDLYLVNPISIGVVTLLTPISMQNMKAVIKKFMIMVANHLVYRRTDGRTGQDGPIGRHQENNIPPLLRRGTSKLITVKYIKLETLITFRKLI